MKIFVEAGRLSDHHFTGIGNVASQALLAWTAMWPEHQFIVASYIDLNAHFLTELRQRSNVSVLITPVPRWVPHGTRNAAWFYGIVPRLIQHLKPDLYWAASSLVPFFLPRATRVLTTVYDLVPILHRDTMGLKGRIISALSYRYSLLRSDVLWTISHHVKADLVRHIPSARIKPIVVACAIDQAQFQSQTLTAQAKEAVLRRIVPGHPGGRTLLFVGTTEPRKNLGFLISLMPDLARDDISLIIVGGKGWGNALDATAKRIVAEPGNRIFFAGRITNNDLADLYAAVSMFVSTSIDEGFCMPAVEAMACGTPVVVADNSAMSEIVGVGGIRQPGWDPTAWNETIRNALSQTFEPLVQAGIYHWTSQLKNVTHALSSPDHDNDHR